MRCIASRASGGPEKSKAAIDTPIRFPLVDPQRSCKLNLTSRQNLSDPMTVADLPLHHAAPEGRSVMGS